MCELEYLSGRPLRQSSGDSGDRDDLRARPRNVALAVMVISEAGKYKKNGYSTSSHRVCEEAWKGRYAPQASALSFHTKNALTATVAVFQTKFKRLL